jgi:transposase
VTEIQQPRSLHPAVLIDWGAYRTRNVIERLVGRLMHFRRVAARYEKLVANYLGMVEIANHGQIL